MSRSVFVPALLFGVAVGLASLGLRAEPPAGKGDHECACEPDRHDPAAVAGAVLTAYKGKDFKAMAALGTEGTAKICLELAEQGEKHPRYNSLFSGSRWEAVQAWDGTTLIVRYRDHGGHADAIVGFHKLGEEIAYVLLHEGENGFAFDDVKKIDIAKFEQMSEQAPKSHGAGHDGHGH